MRCLVLAVLRRLLEQGASATRPGKSRQTPLALVTRPDKRRWPQVAALLREFGAEH